MSPTDARIVERMWETAEKRLPTLSPDEQWVALVLYGELKGGAPVTVRQFADTLGVAGEEAHYYLEESALSSMTDFDDAGVVRGFYGLSTTPASRPSHRFIVNGKTLWTWCAGDALFLAELLDATARVESDDPESGEPIRLVVSPTGVESLELEKVLLSMNAPEAWEVSSVRRILATACHHIFFFASAQSGERWTDRHPNIVLLPVESDAFAYSRLQNKRLFGDALKRRDSNVGHPE